MSCAHKVPTIHSTLVVKIPEKRPGCEENVKNKYEDQIQTTCTSSKHGGDIRFRNQNFEVTWFKN